MLVGVVEAVVKAVPIVVGAAFVPATFVGVPPILDMAGVWFTVKQLLPTRRVDVVPFGIIIRVILRADAHSLQMLSNVDSKMVQLFSYALDFEEGSIEHVVGVRLWIHHKILLGYSQVLEACLCRRL